MVRRLAILLSSLMLAVVFLALDLTRIASAQSGPHGGYTATGDTCAACHRTHTGLSARLMNSVATLNDFCFSCHDGSGAPATPVVSTHGSTDFSTRTEESFELACVQCHDPHGSGSLYAIKEFVLIKPLLGIRSGPVVFTATAGANSYDDGTSPVSSRICVTCHANPDNPGYPMTYHVGGVNHLGGADYTGQDCAACHPHSADQDLATVDGFMPLGGCTDCHGQPPDGTTSPNRDGSHSTHFIPTAFGPQFDPGVCNDCHLFSAATHIDGQATFADSQPLSTTTACDGCHSPGGAFNGVDSTSGSVGARDNWYSGVYTGTVTMTLQTGKENWCVGCHDSGTSMVGDVLAPNVAGDVAQTYGYYQTGHGQNDMVLCTACHDTAVTHTDGLSRTYTAAAGNYQTGYRLKSVNGQPPLAVPDFSSNADARDRPGDYGLCFSCHDQYRVLGDLGNSGDYQLSEWGTNFRNDRTKPQNTVNDHYRHVNFNNWRWDSDWDGETDANINCTSCHNVHGPERPTAMVRTGELISRTTALNVVWLTNLEGEPYSFTYDLASSTGGLMESNCDIQGGDVGCSNKGDVANTGVCTMCHQSVKAWYRYPVPGSGPPGVTSQSITSGNWNDGSTWDRGVPGPGDTVIISPGTTITVTSSVQVDDLTIESGGALVLSAGSSSAAEVTQTNSCSVQVTDLHIQNSGALVIQAGCSLMVEGTLTNDGELRQTLSSVPGGSTTEFLRIKNSAGTATKYYGVDIYPTSGDMGSTTVSVYGNQICPNSASTAIQRCYEIAPATAQAATITFYYRDAEENEQDVASIWHWNDSSSTWDLQTFDSRDGSGMENNWVKAIGVDSYWPFAGSNDSPSLNVSGNRVYLPVIIK